jgi:hypothetical protein
MKIVLEDGASTQVLEKEEEFVYAMIQLFQLWIVSMVDFAKLTLNVDQKENVQPVTGVVQLVKSK